ncbi:F0F1 ATP synthase subunit B family protein [Dyadobacter frigoris]|uniref:ATP synthase subunit b n=1 Tax=Dyadobacter frigoris TaxID=2576211 RepID=A0A4V6BIT8_9BACT|nr:F0F1 ATP synthase subunit B [Dyadobacter frigoris]TKT90373.1 F0F1 ATP synthase subunit B [Dyadobacter frigoris]GLU57472.1 ATP synthase subunit B [Dyadobacter frigoris]
MQIDWFTVIAQIINFFILVWLLRRFLYKPILSAIDDREKKIVGQIQDAENGKSDAKKEKELFVEKNKTFDEQKEQRVKESVDAVKAERKKQMDQVGKEAGVAREEHKKSLLKMQDDMVKTIAEKTQREVLQISRKTLTDLASVSLEEQTTAVFLEKLRAMKPEEIKRFTQAFKSDSDHVLVATAFEISSGLQTQIRSEVDKMLGVSGVYDFKVLPQIISGVELSLNGYKLAWTVSAYLDALKDGVSETAKQNAEPVVEEK